MIKKFLACTTIRERIDLLSNTFMDSWSEQDLNIILSAFNMNAEDYAGKAEKISAIEQYLASYKKQVEQKATMNCSKMDSTPAKEYGETLYQGCNFGNVLKNLVKA